MLFDRRRALAFLGAAAAQPTSAFAAPELRLILRAGRIRPYLSGAVNSIAPRPDGGFLISGRTSNYLFDYRTFDAGGAPQGALTRVDPSAAVAHVSQGVTLDDGVIIFAFIGALNSAASDVALFTVQLSPDGVLLGPPKRVNSTTAHSPYSLSVFRRSGRTAFVAWTDRSAYGVSKARWRILGRKEIPIPVRTIEGSESYALGFVDQPEMGAALVFYRPSAGDVFVQKIASTGAAAGEPVALRIGNVSPAVASGPDGRIGLAWKERIADQNHIGLRVLRANGSLAPIVRSPIDQLSGSFSMAISPQSYFVITTGGALYRPDQTNDMCERAYLLNPKGQLVQTVTIDRVHDELGYYATPSTGPSTSLTTGDIVGLWRDKGANFCFQRFRVG